MGPIKIIIVDDHQMIREGLKQLLQLEGDIQVIGEAKDGIECMELLDKMIPDVLLLDINMPNMNGLQVLERIKEKKIRVKVLILTIHNEIEYLLRSVEIGIQGYVLKDSESALLRKAIYAINNGETFIQSNLASLLKRKISEKKEKSVEVAKLTKREIEVLKLLAEGLFNKEIASRLNISEKTVKNHISNIFKKISVSDRTQAAVYAIRKNIVNIF